MKKLLYSLLSCTIIASSCGSISSCSSADRSLVVDNNEVNYLMEQYAKAVFENKKNNENVSMLFKKDILNESTKILRSKFKINENNFRYNEIFEKYFSEKNFIDKSTKLININNVLDKRESEDPYEGINSICSIIQTFINVLSSKDTMNMIMKLISNLNIIPIITSKMEQILSYGKVLFNKKYISIIQESLSNDKYVGKTYQESLDIATNRFMKTFLYKKVNKNILKSEWGEKIETISSFIDFFRTTAFYLNKFNKIEMNEISIEQINKIRNTQITKDDANEFDLGALFKILNTLFSNDESIGDEKRENAFCRLLAPLFLYDDSDLKINLSIINFTIDVDKSNLDKEKNESKEKHAGISYFLQQFINKNLNNLSIDRISLSNSMTIKFSKKLNISILISKLISVAVSQKKLDFGFLANGVIKKMIESKVTDQNLKLIIDDLFSDVSKSFVDITKIYLRKIKIFEISLSEIFEILSKENIVVNFDDLKYVLDILTYIDDLQNNPEKFLEEIGFVDNKIVDNSPLDHLVKLFSKLKGFNSLLKKITDNLTKIISERNKKLSNIKNEIINLEVDEAKIISFDKKNNYHFEYKISNTLINIYLKQNKNQLFISEIDVK